MHREKSIQYAIERFVYYWPFVVEILKGLYCGDLVGFF